MQLGCWQRQLFEAGTNDSDLCQVFDLLRQQFQADTYTVVLANKQPFSPSQSGLSSWSSTLSDDDMAFYIKHIDDDVLLNTYLQRGLTGQACIADQLLAFEEIQHVGFRERLLPYFRFRYSLSILTSFDREQDFAITLHRHYGAQPFSEQNRQQLQQVADSLMGWTIHYRQLSLLQRDKRLIT